MPSHSLLLLPLFALSTLASIPFAPTAGSTWNIELDKVPSASQADNSSYHIWDYDVLDAPQSTIAAFQAKGHPVICYFSAGTWESWRSDAGQFPAAAIGKEVSGWPKEKWLNTSDPTVRAIMVKRIDIAQSKGCNAIDPDNVDGYDNDTGFDLTQDDAVNYLHFLASTASFRGMSTGLKNAGDIVDRVLNITAFAVNEQCVQYHECATFQAYIKANKPVFHIEYTAKQPADPSFMSKSCDAAGAVGFSTLVKHLNLDAWTETCPVGSAGDDTTATTTTKKASTTTTTTTKKKSTTTKTSTGTNNKQHTTTTTKTTTTGTKHSTTKTVIIKHHSTTTESNHHTTCMSSSMSVTPHNSSYTASSSVPPNNSSGNPSAYPSSRAPDNSSTGYPVPSSSAPVVVSSAEGGNARLVGQVAQFVPLFLLVAGAMWFV